MKSPDETKKGLECCIDGFSCRPTCPYTTPFFNIEKCTQALATDALALIQQFEAQNAELSGKIGQLETENHQLIEKIEQLQAERDAAVRDINIAKPCRICKNKNDDYICSHCDIPGRDFEWRGVQKEE